MNPYDHAVSSAAIHGGCWRDYHRIHAWFDETKAAQCHFTHRALRHHVQGAAEALRVLGTTVRNSNGIEIDVAEIGRQHMREDCGRMPEASDWLEDFRPADWMPTVVDHDAASLAALSAKRHGDDAKTYLPVHAWFLETSAWADDAAHLLFRHHAFGIFEAEALFGPVIGTGRHALPTRVLAERHVQTVVGRTPTAADWLRRIKGERWMVRSPRLAAANDDATPRNALTAC